MSSASRLPARSPTQTQAPRSTSQQLPHPPTPSPWLIPLPGATPPEPLPSVLLLPNPVAGLPAPPEGAGAEGSPSLPFIIFSPLPTRIGPTRVWRPSSSGSASPPAPALTSATDNLRDSGGLLYTLHFHFVALLSPLEKLWKTSQGPQNPRCLASLVAPFLNFPGGTDFLPAQPSSRGCKERRVNFAAGKVHTFPFLSFRLPGSADQSKCDCAPLVLHIHDYKFPFRFPSVTLQVQTINFRRVIKGGEYTPGGVGGSGAGLRPGDGSRESGGHRDSPRFWNNTRSTGGSPAAPPPTHLPPLASWSVGNSLPLAPLLKPRHNKSSSLQEKLGKL
ncbi:uncharacterized protein [Kogia breviceps]|uniref:uncharacterized protein n=1 Tax=Kogia breviceps TaxID=27615 RepID=UPI0034D2475D